MNKFIVLLCLLSLSVTKNGFCDEEDKDRKEIEKLIQNQLKEVNKGFETFKEVLREDFNKREKSQELFDDLKRQLDDAIKCNKQAIDELEEKREEIKETLLSEEKIKECLEIYNNKLPQAAKAVLSYFEQEQAKIKSDTELHYRNRRKF